MMKTLAWGTGLMAVAGTGAWFGVGRANGGPVRVDFTRCTGCRTCEAVCAAASDRPGRSGAAGPGNPRFSRIRVYSYNPDVDIPSVCALCPDAPCISACPGRGGSGGDALYRDAALGVIRNSPETCIGCGACVQACRNKRTGVLAMDADTGTPTGACDLCGGDPLCVANCPYDALQIAGGRHDPVAELPPDRINPIVSQTLYPDLS